MSGTIEKRPATDAEVDHYLRHNRKVGFRHFVVERFSPRAANGVSHRQRSTAKVRWVDGRAHVRHHREVVELTGTHCTLPSGREFIADVRVKSEYLPSNI